MINKWRNPNILIQVGDVWNELGVEMEVITSFYLFHLSASIPTILFVHPFILFFVSEWRSHDTVLYSHQRIFYSYEIHNNIEKTWAMNVYE